MKTKEEIIQKNQRILETIDNSVVGLAAVYNHFDGFFNHDNKIDMVEINDGEVESYEDFAKGLQEHYLPEAIKEAHNKYVALLTEWRYRKANQLTELLKND